MTSTKKTTKKTPAKKKAAPAVLPPNPDRTQHAIVRTTRCDFDTAARYIKEYGFFLHKQDGKHYHLTADKEANEKFTEGGK